MESFPLSYFAEPRCEKKLIGAKLFRKFTEIGHEPFWPTVRSFASFPVEEEGKSLKSEDEQERKMLDNEFGCSSSDSFYPWSKKKVIRADKLFKVPQLITEIGRDPFRPMVRGFTTSSTEEKVTSSSTKDEKEVTSSSTKDEEEVASFPLS
ncbi:uncharacterized protein LOC127768369 [Oryza glaberrima]|uniref:uncharacterized protein LOC127768369 n=1 Tax=Oryza glaberrima TaxID=4538 RepID=UPI00224C3458|nr:uncharacterized protein LOC127768369 [Oryza glaberrima]